MRFKLLGKSGLRVSELCLGNMTFGTEWGFGTGREESKKVFDAYADAGGNFIDTANKYNEGTSEKYLAEFIGTERERFVIATKYTLSMRSGDPNAGGNHRKNMMHSIDASLKRLKTDYIDLYWLHVWDYTTPVEEVMRGLDDLVRAGKINYIGISDAPAWVTARSNAIAELQGWSQFIALQMKYSLFERSIEREFIPMAKELDIAVTAWGVLNYGLLTGKYSVEDGKLLSTDNSKRYAPEQASILDERKLAILGEVKKIAEETASTMAQVAIAWVRGRGVLPIIGAKTENQIKENLKALDVTLDDSQMERLEVLSKIELGFPYDFASSDVIRKRIFGGSFDQIDNHRR
jgi:aryl-alcohol dehydrogenase-like predicted oxidoreductase